MLADPNTGLSDGHFLSTHEYLQAKALASDTSDFIDGIEKVGMKMDVPSNRAFTPDSAKKASAIFFGMTASALPNAA